MRVTSTLNLFVIVPILVVAIPASCYLITDTIIGPDFYHFFHWQDITDPTHGRVYVSLEQSLPCHHSARLFLNPHHFFNRNYVDKVTSQKLNLTYACDDTFILRTDHTTVLNASGPGRNSVRIKSHKSYTQHVAVYVFNFGILLFCVICLTLCFSWYRFDVRHMPQGCGSV